jgi:hypothetical protein
MIIVGCDPDSKAHGVAIYMNGKLSVLSSMKLMTLYEQLYNFRACSSEVEIHIEDVCANNAVFMKPGRGSTAEAKARSRTLGMCQQAQIEVERMGEYFGAKIVRHKISKKWKDAHAGKREFELATGWTGRSNPDTRSAAYFGFLGLK